MCLKTAFALTWTAFLLRIQQVKSAEDRALEQRSCHLQHPPGSCRAAANPGSEQQPTTARPGHPLSSD